MSVTVRRRRRPVEEPDPDRDDLRGGDDLHRPDHRLDRRAPDPGRPGPVEQRHAVGDQRLPAGAGRPVRLRRPPGRYGRAPQDGRARSDHLRRLVGAVRPDAQRRGRGDLARGVPRAAGRGRGHHVPGRAGHRGADLRPALPRPGPGPVLRHRRRADRDRPDRGRLPAGVDLAGHLLDQRAGRPDRPGPDRHLQAGHRAPARADGLPRPGPDRRRRGAERVRAPAVLDLGLGQPGHRGLHRRGPGDPRPSSSPSSGGPPHR